jgi:hypothetical protein
MTPGSSYSDPSRLSPHPPSSGSRSPMMKLNRAATTPMPGPYDQPSPDLPSTFDNPFPPFPPPTPKRSHTPVGSRPSTRGRQEQQHYSPEYDRRMAPMSPRVNGGAYVAQKMDSVRPGPFDRRPSGPSDRTPTEAITYGLPATPGSRTRTRSRSSTTSSNGRSAQPVSHLRQESTASSISRSSAYSQQSYERKHDPLPPVPRPQDNPYGRSYERESPMMQALGPDNRSKTFPVRKESFPSQERQRPFLRRPSETREGMASGNVFAESPTSGNYNDFKPSSFQQKAVNPFSKAANQMAAAPDFQVERPMQIFRPGDMMKGSESSLHTPSDSASSDGSSSSFDVRSASSMSSAPSDYGDRSRPPPPPSRPSPIEQSVSIDDFLAREMATGPRRREQRNGSLPRDLAPAPVPAAPANTSNESAAAAQFRTLAHRARDLLWNNPSKANEPLPQEEQQEQQQQPEQQEKPRPQQQQQRKDADLLSTTTWLASLTKSSNKVSPIQESPDSPTDPAICRGLIRHERNVSRGGSGSHQRSRSTGSASGRRPMDRQQPPPPPPPPLPRSRDVDAAEVTPRRAGPPNRGNCRGCRQPIVGKCMKAADGSLTGRWHKACKSFFPCFSPLFAFLPFWGFRRGKKNKI